MSKSPNDCQARYCFDDFALAYPPLPITAVLKQQPEDFRVEERLGYELSGQGEHLWCLIEKRGCNSDWLAKQLAKLANTSLVNIGYAGQKDRQAVTQQWFSVPCGVKQQLDLESLNSDDIKILQQCRHHKKLRRGELTGNRFILLLRNLDSTSLSSQQIIQSVEQRLKLIAQQGVPNYFGKQRFGRNYANLQLGQNLLSGSSGLRNTKNRRRNNAQRNQQSLAISAIRSWMFNQLLSLRIIDGNWQQILDGDVCCQEDADLVCGSLCGDAPLSTQAQALNYEKQVLESYADWYQGLCQQRVKPGLRAFKLKINDLQWQWQTDDPLSLQISFELPKGSFATMLVRELLQTEESI